MSGESSENREPSSENGRALADRRETPQRIQRFEDIIAWKLARVLARDVYNLTSSPAIARDFGFTSQIQRAAVSVMNNIAEGYERRSQGELSHYLLIAKASAAEVRSMSYLGYDIGFFCEDVLAKLLRQTDEIARVLSSFRSSVIRSQEGLAKKKDEKGEGG